LRRQQEQQQQQYQAYWDAYGYTGYGYGGYGGYGGAAAVSYPEGTVAGAAGSSSNRPSDSAPANDPWAAYAHDYQQPSYSGATHAGYSAYPGYSQYAAYGSGGASASAQEDPQAAAAVAAAWAKYYSQWQQPSYGYTWPSSYTNGSTAAAAGYGSTPVWNASAPGAAGSAVAGAAQGNASCGLGAASGEGKAQRGDARGRCEGGVAQGGVEDEGSELSFAALRGEPLGRGASGVPAVLQSGSWREPDGRVSAT
ncbi:hypothetical protein Agub_g758, partial [Astrephomene gubernaculifera]